MMKNFFMKYFSSRESKPHDNELLDEIVNILFPAPEIIEGNDPRTGKPNTKVMVDFSVDYNLQQAYQDLVTGENDSETAKVIANCMERIKEIRFLVNRSFLPENYSDISHIFVDIPGDDRYADVSEYVAKEPVDKDNRYDDNH